MIAMMKRVMVQVPVDMDKRLREEVKKGKWSSMSDAMRYYARRGMEG